MNTIRFAAIALLLGSCQNTMTLENAATREMTGTYLYTSQDFNNAIGKALNQHLTLTSNKATLSHGSLSTDFDYEVKDGFIYLITGNDKVRYRIINHDSLRDEGINGFGAGYYVRVDELN